MYMRGLILTHVKKPMSRDQVTHGSVHPILFCMPAMRICVMGTVDISAYNASRLLPCYKSNSGRRASWTVGCRSYSCRMCSCISVVYSDPFPYDAFSTGRCWRGRRAASASKKKSSPPLSSESNTGSVSSPDFDGGYVLSVGGSVDLRVRRVSLAYFAKRGEVIGGGALYVRMLIP